MGRKAKKKAALDMLTSGIFGENLLKGHTKRKKTYAVSLSNLITELVYLNLEYADPTPISYIQEDIVKTFDYHFAYVSATAQLAGVKEKLIKKCWESWREKIFIAVANDKNPRHWSRLINEKVFGGQSGPQQIAYRFADLFLSHVLLAPP